VRFETFQEIWKFTTYYMIGTSCMENLLFDPTFWLSSFEDDVSIEVSIPEETLNLTYKRILMQEGSLFARCIGNQIFDSSMSSGELYLEQGEISDVCINTDGTDGRPVSYHLFHSARGTCVATEEYDAEGPDELSMAPGDRIIIVGLLVSCFDWFTGRKEATGEVGLVKTSLVKPTSDISEWVNHQCSSNSVTLQRVCMPPNVYHVGLCFYLFYLLFVSICLLIICSFFSYNFLFAKVGTPHAELNRTIGRILEPGKDSPDHTITMNMTLEDSLFPKDAQNQVPPHFAVLPILEGPNSTESFTPLFSFLEGQDYNVKLGALYRLSSELLTSTVFIGHSDEDQLIAFLGIARETARKKRLFWSQTRLCFLLGKLCAGRSKFSQARVYLEEALSIPREGFGDLQLLSRIYSNLAAIYLLQKNSASFFAVTQRLAGLILGVPDCLHSIEDNSVLKYILKRAVLSHNKMAEARACYLLAKYHWTCADGAQAVPYLERLIVLCAEAQKTSSISLSHGYLTLGRLYRQICLPHLSVSSARTASLQPSVKLSNCLHSMHLVLDNIHKLHGISGQDAFVPPQVAPFLHQALSCIRVQGDQKSRHDVLNHLLNLCLSQLFYKHRMIRQAVHQMHLLIKNPPSQQPSIPVPERNSALIWLAWLHINNRQPSVALDILDSVLSSMPEHCTTPQEGQLVGIVLRQTLNLYMVTESYQAAVDICQEYEDLPNWAVAQANLGLLCLKAGAKGLAQRHLTEAVQLFSELEEEGHEANFISVLLKLGHHYVTQEQLHYGKGCYEWALLLAIKANLLDCGSSFATRDLCHLYGCKNQDQAQCIIYNQHQVQLLRLSGDRGQEGDTLEAISQLYLTLGTERSVSLDYTKRSLGIFIDLGCREKAAYGWLCSGKIYHLLGQTELVDLYIQVAQDIALSTGDTNFILKLLETAGDIFFNSCQDREKSITFYRDQALPIAVKSSNSQTRLRLCNKLTEVMIGLQLYGEAIEFAYTALDISITHGECLNERVACHRLASLYHRLEQYELAEHYYLKTLTLCPTPMQFDEETLFYVRVYRTLGDIIFYDLKDPFDAAGYYHLALAAAMDLGNKRSQLQLCTRLATIYHNFLIDRELSLFFYQKARGFAAELNVRRINIAPDQHHSSITQDKVFSLFQTMRLRRCIFTLTCLDCTFSLLQKCNLTCLYQMVFTWRRTPRCPMVSGRANQTIHKTLTTSSAPES
uniref:SH3 domain and tetratricopeptide repeats 1 n=1 Tax=Echeneis naucrates TaxID=173247 RepID=A0A665WPQ9_ECHNA